MFYEAIDTHFALLLRPAQAALQKSWCLILGKHGNQQTRLASCQLMNVRAY